MLFKMSGFPQQTPLKFYRFLGIKNCRFTMLSHIIHTDSSEFVNFFFSNKKTVDLLPHDKYRELFSSLPKTYKIPSRPVISILIPSIPDISHSHHFRQII